MGGATNIWRGGGGGGGGGGGAVIFITMLLHFHYFISLERADTQKREVFLLRTSLGNVNALVATCHYPQIYKFAFRKEFLETL